MQQYKIIQNCEYSVFYITIIECSFSLGEEYLHFVKQRYFMTSTYQLHLCIGVEIEMSKYKLHSFA